MWVRGVDPKIAEIRKYFNLKYVKLLTVSIEKNYDDQDTKLSHEFSSKRASLVDKIQEKVSQTPGLRKVHFGKSIQI